MENAFNPFLIPRSKSPYGVRQCLTYAYSDSGDLGPPLALIPCLTGTLRSPDHPAGTA